MVYKGEKRNLLGVITSEDVLIIKPKSQQANQWRETHISMASRHCQDAAMYACL
jgi:virulence-associated protein VagC